MKRLTISLVPSHSFERLAILNQFGSRLREPLPPLAVHLASSSLGSDVRDASPSATSSPRIAPTTAAFGGTTFSAATTSAIRCIFNHERTARLNIDEFSSPSLASERFSSSLHNSAHVDAIADSSNLDHCCDAGEDRGSLEGGRRARPTPTRRASSSRGRVWIRALATRPAERKRRDFVFGRIFHDGRSE